MKPNTFVLRNNIIVGESYEKGVRKMEEEEYPVRILEEIGKIIKSKVNYLNVYLRKNRIPSPPKARVLPQQKDREREIAECVSKREILNYHAEKLFQSNNFNPKTLEKSIVPMEFTEKLAKALGMKSATSPPPYFNRLVDLGVPYYYQSNKNQEFFIFAKKEKGQKYKGINDYLPLNFPRNEWRKTKINREWLRRKPAGFDQVFPPDEKHDSDVIIDESKDVEKEINKHIRCAVPIYEDEVEIENISDDD